MFKAEPGTEILAHKIRLKPNCKQQEKLAQAAGVARFAYNWGLSEWERQNQLSLVDPEVTRPDWMSLNRRLNAIKRDEFPWMLEVTKCAPERALMELGRGYRNFFAKRARRPRYHKKGVHDSFYLHRNAIKIKGKKIWVPKLGWIRMYEPLRFNGKITSATVSRQADCWFVSVAVETPKPEIKPRPHAVVGVDLGCTTLATLSTGEKIKGPKPHKALLSRQRRLQRSLARKQKGSRNRAKARLQLARHHMKVANIRRDALHKLTTRLVRDFTVIGIEDLNVSGMSKNHALARSILDQGFGEFRRQLEYKAARSGVTIVTADRFFPSTKRCSSCGFVLSTIPLAARSWTCPSCGAYHDRDLNAAKNLEQMAAWSAASACGEEGSGRNQSAAQPASLKQEVKEHRAPNNLNLKVQVIC